MPRLSIVIPAYAEAEHLSGTLHALRRFLVERGWLTTTEVIVVTADAADATAAIARRELRRFAISQHLQPGAKVGKGRDVRCGMLAARGRTVMFMDADLATPLGHVPAAVSAIEAGSDVVIGRRELARMHHAVGRRLTSQLSNYLVRALLLPGIADTQCGFKAFRGSLVAALFAPLETMGWGFDLEVLARARQLGAQISELAIPDWFDPKGERGLAGEVQWVARLNTLRELFRLAMRFERAPTARRRELAFTRTAS